MRKRGVVQVRGRYRAVLPQAIANPLAEHALDRIPPTVFDAFCQTLTPRMLISVSRRLGFLHDSRVAQAIVARWLQRDGPLGDLTAMEHVGLQLITNIAPVAPELVLAKFEEEFTEDKSNVVGHQWIGLIKAIAYDASLFDRAAGLLARCVGSEMENNNLSSARNTFRGLFHLYLSGTEATPEQRRSLIKRHANSREENLRQCVPIAIRALLTSNGFMSSSGSGFGARSRDWGWQPNDQHDVGSWFKEAISLAVEVLPDAEARELVAENVRALWRHPACRDALDRSAAAFIIERPWVEGWIALRACLRYDGKMMVADVRSRLEQLIDRLKPLDLLNQARAVVLNRMNKGIDFEDGEESAESGMHGGEIAGKMAQEIGCALAGESRMRAEFLAELLLESQARRAFEFGRGLAEGAEDLDGMWHELVKAFGSAKSQSAQPGRAWAVSFTKLDQSDPTFSSSALDAASSEPALAPILPYLQARVGIDVEGIVRLQRAIVRNILMADCFRYIANGSVSQCPSEPLAALLEEIASLSGGVEVALDILHMRLFRSQEDARALHPQAGDSGTGPSNRSKF